MKLPIRYLAFTIPFCVSNLIMFDRAVAQSPPTKNQPSRFVLSAPQLGVESQAIVAQDRIRITDSQGNVTDYERDTHFDSQDHTWMGFLSAATHQVLRWPTSHSGRMQIGTIRDGIVEYRFSQMTIQAAAADTTFPTPLRNRLPNETPQRSSRRPVMPPTQLQGVAGSLIADLAVNKLLDTVSRGGRGRNVAQMLRLASFDQRGTPWVLTRGRSLDLSCIRTGSAIGTDWWVSPIGNGFVRVETYDRGRVHAISVNQVGRLSMLPLSQDSRQLWRVRSGARVANQFLLENVAYPGNCLARHGGAVTLQPVTYAAPQLWMSYTAPTVPTFQPFLRTIHTEVVANSQLTPAKLELTNTHHYALVVLLGDTRNGALFETIRIEPNHSHTLTLDRDAGATAIETVETRSAAGVWERQQFVTAIPPAAYYDLSIYEEHLQSIAIDATGKSPNPIEDVNYVPKSVGWLPLPAGAELPANGQLDVYPRAKAANNPGAVRRMDKRQFDEKPATNPLESILDKYQSVPRKKF